MKRNVLTLGRVLGLCLLVTGAVVLAGCQAKPDEVATQLAEAVNTQDLDTALALFAEDAVVNSASPEPFTGKAEIQGWLEGMFADNFEIEIEIPEVKGDVVIEHDKMSMDSMRFFGIDSLEGTSEITVQDGKISALNFAWSDETLADLQAAPFVAPEDLIGVWTVGTFIQFNEDGTSRVADKIPDLSAPVDEEHPGVLEAWTYDGMVITFQSIACAGEDCPAEESCGQVGVFFVKWAGEDLDRLRFKAIDDPCAARRLGLQYGDWAPVSP
jgi:hypothetical protein